ncbi:MAG: HAMP domain-containing sensor histidine kinase [Candidatus Acidiferrum sp.]
MSKKWHLTDRTKMLLKLELAITLPAVALMAFNIWNLKHIQRDQAIEAAIQRDFNYILKIAEKKSFSKATDLVEPVRRQYPKPKDGAMNVKAELDRLLFEHPEFAYAVLYDKQTNMLISRMQEGGGHDLEFCERRQEAMDSVASWMPIEATDMVEHLRMMNESSGQPVAFYGDWMAKRNRHVYVNGAYFIPAGVAKDEVTLAVVSFDDDYLQKDFFPGVIKDVLNSKSNGPKNDAKSPAIMVHLPKESTPIAASANWVDGTPEVERTFDMIFQRLVWGIKYQGTTVADITKRFVRYNYSILGALSVLMLGGIFLTYRNISREMNLARLKSDFVANVSHELRTPLALIRLYAETLELGRLHSPEKQHEYFRIIREESERLSALINNILDFSRIEAGRKEYDFKETNLSELVRSTLDSYRFQIEQNGFALEENISPDIPPVNVDREAIARSLLNLVNNALKYSKDRKYIGVNLYRANGSVKLEVRDHGIGIPASEQEKIFEKFYRCGDPLVHNIKGSGLGLSLVRHIVRAHGGDVKVESSPDRGSTFTIALPLGSSLQTGAALA